MINLIQDGEIVGSPPVLLLAHGERKQFEHRPGTKARQADLTKILAFPQALVAAFYTS